MSSDPHLKDSQRFSVGCLARHLPATWDDRYDRMERQLISQWKAVSKSSKVPDALQNVDHFDPSEHCHDFKSGLLISFMDLVNPEEKWKRRERHLAGLSHNIRQAKHQNSKSNQEVRSQHSSASRSTSPARSGAGTPISRPHSSLEANHPLLTAWFDEERAEALLTRRPRSTVFQESSGGSVRWMVSGPPAPIPAPTFTERPSTVPAGMKRKPNARFAAAAIDRPASQASLAATRPSSAASMTPESGREFSPSPTPYGDDARGCGGPVRSALSPWSAAAAPADNLPRDAEEVWYDLDDLFVHFSALDSLYRPGRLVSSEWRAGDTPTSPPSRPAGAAAAPRLVGGGRRRRRLGLTATKFLALLRHLGLVRADAFWSHLEGGAPAAGPPAGPPARVAAAAAAASAQVSASKTAAFHAFRAGLSFRPSASLGGSSTGGAAAGGGTGNNGGGSAGNAGGGGSLDAHGHGAAGGGGGGGGGEGLGSGEGVGEERGKALNLAQLQASLEHLRDVFGLPLDLTVRSGRLSVRVVRPALLSRTLGPVTGGAPPPSNARAASPPPPPPRVASVRDLLQARTPKATAAGRLLVVAARRAVPLPPPLVTGAPAPAPPPPPPSPPPAPASSSAAAWRAGGAGSRAGPAVEAVAVGFVDHMASGRADSPSWGWSIPAGYAAAPRPSVAGGGGCDGFYDDDELDGPTRAGGGGTGAGAAVGRRRGMVFPQFATSPLRGAAASAAGSGGAEAAAAGWDGHALALARLYCR